MSLDGVVCSMVLGALFCFGQHSSTAPMKRFRDDTYKFSYRYPLYLEAKPSAAAEALLSDTPCIKMPLDARRATSADHDVLEIIEIDFACLGRHADADVMDSVVMKNAGGSLKAFGGQPRLGKPHRYSLNGLAAEYLEASVDAPSVRKGMVLHFGSVCVLMDQTVVCWLLESADLGRLQSLLADPVEFDRYGPMPLIPGRQLNQP